MIIMREGKFYTTGARGSVISGEEFGDGLYEVA
jgi:hypothetical protein